MDKPQQNISAYVPLESMAQAQTTRPSGLVSAPVALPINFGPEPQRVVCPFCNAEVKTTTKTMATTKTHIMACILCLSCFICSCIPHCVESCKNMNHYCPSCDAYLGVYNR